MEQSGTQIFRPKIKAVYRYEVVDTEKTPQIAGGRFHFIGAGGVGMSGLAKVMLKNKAIVTGSDQTPSAVTDKLCELGADIKTGHCVENLHPHTEAVVISAAVTENNPELMHARARGCRVY
jgi:UDP-N-acetylmuramate--alanine ligase